jgi:hypothetical protein
MGQRPLALHPSRRMRYTLLGGCVSHTVTVGNGLTAYFKQPQGPSRPGVDWVVQIAGETAVTVMVRTYFSSDPPREAEKPALAEKAARFITKKLAMGWVPQAGKFLEADDVAEELPKTARPWWKLFS